MGEGPDRFDPAGDEPLERRSARSAAATLLAQGARVGLGLASMAALARLLTPHDFGLVGGVAAVLGLLTAVRELGLNVATVQRPRIEAAQVSTLFWINVAFAAGLWLALAGVAPLLGRLAGEPQVPAIAVALGATLPLGALAAQPRALLQRRMEFRVLAGCDVAALALGSAAGVAGAVLGAGVAALVAMPIVTEASAALLIWQRSGWRPARPRRGSGVRSMLRFGSQLSAAGLLQHAARQLDKLLIGGAWGAAALGLYGRAHQLVLMPVQQILVPVSSVAIPALSRLQSEPARYRRLYLTALRGVALLSLPPLAALAVLAREAVLVVLGPQWSEAAPLVAVLALAAALQITGHSAGWLFVSLGRTRRMMAWTAAASAALMASVAAGLPWGPFGVACAYTACVAALRLPHFALATRGTPVSLGDVWRALARPAGLALAAAAAMAATRRLCLDEPVGVCVLATLAAGALCWLALAVAWPAARGDLTEILRGIRALRPPRAHPISLPAEGRP